MAAMQFMFAAAAVLVAVALIVIARGGAPPPPTARAPYRLDTDLSGGRLKPGAAPDSMRFYVDADPTHGAVNYGAWDGLVTVTPAGKTVIAAGPVVGGRHNMVRLMSAKTYDSGLFVLSADHIPEGAGTWPAFWLTADEPGGAAWACHGEIDIIEGVNSVDAASSRNVSTLHTSDRPGAAPCRQAGVPGISNGGDCSAGGAAATCGCDGRSRCPTLGCGVQSADPATFGWGFNAAGGGTYACELTPGGAVSMWFFPRGREPADLRAGAPDPAGWPAPYVAFAACPGQFAGLRIVLNTTLCGDWAGNVYPGGPAKCVADVAAADLARAYWSIDYLKVFTLG